MSRGNPGRGCGAGVRIAFWSVAGPGAVTQERDGKGERRGGKALQLAFSRSGKGRYVGGVVVYDAEGNPGETRRSPVRGRGAERNVGFDREVRFRFLVVPAWRGHPPFPGPPKKGMGGKRERAGGGVRAVNQSMHRDSWTPFQTLTPPPGHIGGVDRLGTEKSPMHTGCMQSCIIMHRGDVAVRNLDEPRS